MNDKVEHALKQISLSLNFGSEKFLRFCYLQKLRPTDMSYELHDHLIFPNRDVTWCCFLSPFFSIFFTLIAIMEKFLHQRSKFRQGIAEVK